MLRKCLEILRERLKKRLKLNLACFLIDKKHEKFKFRENFSLLLLSIFPFFNIGVKNPHFADILSSKGNQEYF
jgi:hypothetical protein